jgi:acetoin utilization protein AcuB
MVDNKIGGLPVMRFGKVVGMITETDLFRVFLELMGAREKGVRVTALVEDKPGVLGEITRAVTGVGGNFIAFGQFTGEDVSTKFLTFKVVNASEKDIKEAIWDIAKEVQDIRTCSTNE